ncbi:hypothetical protein DFH29DRAFT_996722 [Suillus ampliporus]|nr:hypothetical protein DFH29DRAFT_996722 [Suillus ampliporus]
MSQPIPSTAPLRAFKDHTDPISAVAVSPDRRRMVTASGDRTLCLWDLKTGVALKKMEGHRDKVWALAVSRDGQFIVSGDESGELIAWHGETGEPLTQPIKAHSSYILSLDFSPDGTVLATGSFDGTAKLRNTKTWKPQANPIQCSNAVRCVRYSPSGELLAIAKDYTIDIYNPDTREYIVNFKAHAARNLSLAWTVDGTRLLSVGDEKDPTIREWDASTWKQVGDPWTGHTSEINDIAMNAAGTLVASASTDNRVRLWRLSDRRTIAIMQHSSLTACVTFSVDGKHILSGGYDKMISEWEVPKDSFPEEAPQTPVSKLLIQRHVSILDFNITIRACFMLQILAINTATRNACVAGDLSTAEELLTREINTDANNYALYASRSFVMTRKHHWDHALRDAIKSVAIQPSLMGYVSKGIALCGKKQVREARTAFDLAFMFADEDSKIIHLLLLIKAYQDEEAIICVQELAAACPNNDTLACRVVEAYLCLQLGINAMNDARHDEAADHFTAAVNSSSDFSSTMAIHSTYEDLVVLFGWDLKSLWQNAHQKWCDTLCRAGRHEEALKSYRYTMSMSDESTKASCIDWSNGKSGVLMSCRPKSLTAFPSDFKRECSVLCAANGDAALTASNYDRAIDLYSAAIDLNSASYTLFANRSQARLGKMLWKEALLDAQKVIELNPSSHVGYKMKHAALHGAQCYNEAIEAFQTMLSKLDNSRDTQTRKLRQQYISPPETERAIRKVIDAQLDNAPLRVLDTTTGLICDREAQILAFKTSIEYKELVSSTITHSDLPTKRIEDMVMRYFQYAMLSHRWEGTEPLLEDIQDNVVYELDPVSGGILKLQSFCKTARDAGCRWAWSDTCCIKKSDPAELEISVKSMFVWYRHSALTIVYLSDVPPSSKSGTLATSAWNTRGWTVQEFLAPKVILFYQKDWTLYLGDRTPNHKESFAIMRELEIATGIARRAILAFRPGMKGVREKLQWASTRATTLEEDIAYSLSGIFGVRLGVDYGEKKQNALGRLLQEIIAQSGDITALDWVGKSSEFNSCLPADITSYEAPPCKLPSPSEDEIQSSVSSLRGDVALESALRLYQTLDHLSAPRFAHRRLHLPCIVFPVTAARRRSGRDQGTYTYEVKADGLHDLQITTEVKWIPFSQARPPPTWQTLLLVRLWNRHLLDLPDPADDTEIVEDCESPLHESSPAEYEPAYSESHLRALRLMVRLAQPFGAFLLARQHNGEYKRIASDHDIIAKVEDVASIHNMMDVRTLEIS